MSLRAWNNMCILQQGGVDFWTRGFYLLCTDYYSVICIWICSVDNEQHIYTSLTVTQIGSAVDLAAQ